MPDQYKCEIQDDHVQRFGFNKVVPMTDQRVIVIVGMHRSGTSALTGTLEQAGVKLGAVSTFDRFNVKGNREHPEILRLHQRLFAYNGGAWHTPPRGVGWHHGHRVVRDDIISGFGDVPVWGFKDPRTLFTIAGWLEVLPQKSLIGIFRHPAAVARSLQRRNRFSVERAYALWAKYNAKLLSLHRAAPFPLLSFDLEPAAFDRASRQAIAELGLAGPVHASFFDEGLRSRSLENFSLPTRVAWLYQELCARQIMSVEQERPYP